MLRKASCLLALNMFIIGMGPISSVSTDQATPITQSPYKLFLMTELEFFINNQDILSVEQILQLNFPLTMQPAYTYIVLQTEGHSASGLISTQLVIQFAGVSKTLIFYSWDVDPVGMLIFSFEQVFVPTAVDLAFNLSFATKNDSRTPQSFSFAITSLTFYLITPPVLVPVIIPDFLYLPPKLFQFILNERIISPRIFLPATTALNITISSSASIRIKRLAITDTNILNFPSSANLPFQQNQTFSFALRTDTRRDRPAIMDIEFTSSTYNFLAINITGEPIELITTGSQAKLAVSDIIAVYGLAGTLIIGPTGQLGYTRYKKRLKRVK